MDESIQLFGHDYLDSVGAPVQGLAEIEDACYPEMAEIFRNAVQQLAHTYSDDLRNVFWGFAAGPEGETGFWYPLRIQNLDAYVDSNGYQNQHMDPKTFGAAVTLVAINHFLWFMDSKRQASEPDAMSAEEIADLTNMYHRMRTFALDLCESEQLDSPSFLSFID